MTDMDQPRDDSRQEGLDSSPTRGGSDEVPVLRGAAPAAVRRGLWIYAGALCLAVFAAILVVSFLSISNDNARVSRMKAHGIPVSVTVTGCLGNIGGSGSTSAGYTCRGDYTIHGATYHELIGSMTTFAAAGTTVPGVVDPSHHGTVVLSSFVRSASASPWRFVTPSILTIVLIALSLGLWNVAHRAQRSGVTPVA